MDLKEILGKLNSLEELTLEDLTELDAQLINLFDEVRKGELEGVEKGDLQTLNELSDATQKVRERATSIAAAQAEADAKIEELAKTVHAVDESKEPEPEPEEEEPKPDGEPDIVINNEAETPSVDPEPEQEPEEEDEPQAATPLPALAAAAKRRPVVMSVQSEPRSMMRATATGEPVDRIELAQKMIQKRSQFGYVSGEQSEKISVGTMTLEVDDDRVLHSGDEGNNEEKVNAVVAAAAQADSALTASGGFCAPLETDYSVDIIANPARPVRDALPRFAADRGGIRFQRPPTLAATDGAVDVWTNAIDLAPGAETKNVLTFVCPAIQEVTVQAITRILRFGNFTGRAAPEQVAAWTDTAAAQWARRAEALLLQQINTASTAVTSTATLGAARDILFDIQEAAAGYRSRNRMAPDAQLRVLLPQWVPDMISADLTRGLQSDPAFLAVTAGNVASYFAARNVNVSYYADTPAGAPVWQAFPAQAAGVLLNFPTVIRSFIFSEGSFVFLDGGTLDLGVVRDSTLNATNDYEIFFESFEAVAFRGVEALALTSTVCHNGQSSAGEDLGSLCVS